MTPERAAWLALLPVFATLIYYALPASLQQNLWITFSPQLLAYGSLAAWVLLNPGWKTALRVDTTGIRPALKWGALVGVALGAVNLSLILQVIPALGGDITFLRETTHAQAPVWVMFPLGIAGIGVLVELNFRGFQMGRLLVLLGDSSAGRVAAAIVSALVFAHDPFMVRVFQHLHVIAVWDGLVWGILLLRTGSLYATMAAHTVEVWILYASLKLWFG
ncbi:MAG: CPBP family intramembrane metalloprotease [Nitrospirae bacterium]|nr:CPBP family intramembrane metalloprotease [Nitrospirota bacterium]